MKIIAFYLPQFHPIKENNEWWGEGFTEWTNVKTAVPTFKGQRIPRIPLNKNYYSLLDVKTLEWQAKLAREYGVYGFAYYHYWSEGHMLLEKPAELMLQHKSVDIPFCFSWANHTWTRCWANKTNEVLWEQKYGDEVDWRNHFDYLLPFFQDDRYIKVDGKPMMILYNPKGVKEYPAMMQKWQQWAREAGLPGIFFLHQQNEFDHALEPGGDLYNGGIEFQSNAAVNKYITHSLGFSALRVLNRIADKIPALRLKCTTMHWDYDFTWKKILEMQPRSDTWYPGAFVDFDNTPRRKNRGQFFDGFTVEKFKKYLTQQVKHARDDYHKDFLFMFAWNEWGESGYLEPDEENGYQLLEAVRDALIENEAFPTWEDHG